MQKFYDALAWVGLTIVMFGFVFWFVDLLAE